MGPHPGCGDWSCASSALAGALAAAAACGGGSGGTPLPGAALTCADTGFGELIACDAGKGVAVIFIKEAILPEGGTKEVDQYFVIPLRVASVEDLRAKTHWAWDHWDIWQKKNIDVCEVKLGVQPSSLMLQLAPEDLKPARCQ